MISRGGYATPSVLVPPEDAKKAKNEVHCIAATAAIAIAATTKVCGHNLKIGASIANREPCCHAKPVHNPKPRVSRSRQVAS